MSENDSRETIWDRNRGLIRSRRGGWIIGRGVLNQGYEMLQDFVGKLSYMQVVILNATGKIPEKKLADWAEAIQICLSWPDPRVWCNHIGALGGTMRASVCASTAAGVMASDSRSYGPKTLVESTRFIQSAKRDLDTGMTVEEIVAHECRRHHGKFMIMGFARPIAKGDERVAAMERTRQEFGFAIGPHLHLAFEIHDVANRNYSESLNIVGYVSAFLSDHGFTPEETYRIFSFVVASGVTACYLDTLERPGESFFPMRCEDVEYSGPQPRAVPD